MRQAPVLGECVELGMAGPFLQIGDLEIEAFHDGVLVFDEEMQVLNANKAALEMVPGNWGEEFPMLLSEVFPETTEEYEWLRRLVWEKISYRNHALNVSRGGKVRTFLIDSYFLRDADQASAGICVFMKDIGNVVSLEEQMQRNEKLATVGKIAAGVAHEIRNPLTSIKGFLQIMRSELVANGMSKEHRYTEVMLSEIERVNMLVGELLLLSKPRELRMEPIEVNDLVMGMAPLISSESLLNNIEFHLSLKTVPRVYADSEVLKQVFLNLIKNAIEAMVEVQGGELVISTDYLPGERMVRIDFKDSGPGIPHYLMDRIFDAFFTTKETGTGLGLPICQRLVNDLGGYVKVMSKGYGTTFSVFIPVVEE